MTLDRKKVIDTAMFFKGAKRGSKKINDVIDVFNTVKPDGYTAHYSDPYCAEFFTSIFIMAYGKKIAQKMIPMSASCPRMVEKAKKMGIWIEKDSHKPKVGEGVIYDWQDSGKGDNKGGPDHVGVVKSVTKKGFVVIEGNMGAQHVVGTRSLLINNRYIRGFIKTDFDAKEKKKNA